MKPEYKTGKEAAHRTSDTESGHEGHHRSLISDVEQNRAKIQRGGGQAATEAQHAKGKTTARERIYALLDQGSFRAVDAYRTHRHTDFGMDEERYPGDGIITGFGKIDGRMVCVYAQDFTVRGGSFSEAQGQKIARVMDIAMDSGIPVIGLLDSVGARIQEGVYSLAAFSDLFWRSTQASGVIPQISVILGPCAGDSAYLPGLSDFVVMIKDTSYMFSASPETIKTVTREETDLDSLGSAEMHSSVSGAAHFVAASEAEALEIVRNLIAYLPGNNAEPPPAVFPEDDPWRQDADLDKITPVDPEEAYDARIVIEKIFDHSSFIPVHERFAPNVVVGFARLHGQAVGVIANQPLALAGRLDLDASDKIARFVRFCDAFNFPIFTFVDTPGFMPGVKQEHGGVIRHGAKIVYAYSEATVPKIAVITRKAYGGAYIMMSSKHIRTDMVFAWPGAEIAVTGTDEAVNILYAELLKGGNNPEKAKKEYASEFEAKYSKPYAAAASGLVDEVLIPSEMRPRLIAALELLKNKRVQSRPKKHGNIPL